MANTVLLEFAQFELLQIIKEFLLSILWILPNSTNLSSARYTCKGDFKPSYTKIGGLLVADESPGHAFERAVLFSGVS